MRRFGLTSMRNLGVGRAGLEKHLLEDMERFIEQIKEEILEYGEYNVNLHRKIDRLAGSTVNRVIFGYPFEDEQMSDFYELKQHMEEQAFLLSSVTGHMLMAMPWLRYFPIFSQTFNKLDNNLSNVYEFLKRPINKRISDREKQTPEERGEPNDLLDCFLDQIEAGKSEYFSLRSITPFCFDLFLAGEETTSVTLSYLILYLILDQRVQSKMHEELDRLEEEKGRNGFDNSVTQADRGKLPFLNAVINETQRVCNLLPLNLTHRTMADAQILGGTYHLRKGISIIPQISCVLFDEKIFPNPLRFEPERFLDDQGQLKRIEEFIPFGLGKRICMGESLAKTELFLFTANFFRHFQVLPVDPLHPPSRFIVKHHHYNCRIIVRTKKEF
uniref:Unspecific monooxygenase n=1 Tax=Meloidogyne floridensis TaxID=298350 RepID=A0A915NWF0_9BILA